MSRVPAIVALRAFMSSTRDINTSAERNERARLRRRFNLRAARLAANRRRNVLAYVANPLFVAGGMGMPEAKGEEEKGEALAGVKEGSVAVGGGMGGGFGGSFGGGIVGARLSAAQALKDEKDEKEKKEEAAAGVVVGSSGRGGRKVALERAVEGPFAVTDLDWRFASPATYRRWSGAARIDRVGAVRKPACRRCRRNHQEGREAHPCRIEGTSKCQWCV
ncbi:unnamed protein product [Zymoseptoria tritici ST99CH_1A5]|uniref:Uncharacterized protein n=1 Tax=Zymoseptoria tritici ST99CH_1A5 TaxID=1276529 RepID=A0A1Y6M1H0_ZYMTR|nr:unnamed protein product [Zymoseptoria tritici ST99CH_1A5]